MAVFSVLIIEDEAMIGLLLEQVLEELGYRVCGIEATQAGAVAAAARYNPDLMIVDVGLRQGNGVSAVAEILQDRFVPHLFLSGDTASILAKQPNAIVIQKPVRVADLDRAIQVVMKADGSVSV